MVPAEKITEGKRKEQSAESMRGVRRSISPGERERVTAKMERTMEEKIFIESESERPPCFAAAKGILGRGERERDGHGFFFFFFYSA